MCDTTARTRMGQTQTASSKAESYTWGVEIECFLPQSKVQELGISVGSYHQRISASPPLPSGLDRGPRRQPAHRPARLRRGRDRQPDPEGPGGHRAGEGSLPHPSVARGGRQSYGGRAHTHRSTERRRKRLHRGRGMGRQASLPDRDARDGAVRQHWKPPPREWKLRPQREAPAAGGRQGAQGTGCCCQGRVTPAVVAGGGA